jgi:hypothetical protein
MSSERGGREKEREREREREKEKERKIGEHVNTPANNESRHFLI